MAACGMVEMGVEYDEIRCFLERVTLEVILRDFVAFTCMLWEMSTRLCVKHQGFLTNAETPAQTSFGLSESW